MDSASDFGSEGCGFKSHPSRLFFNFRCIRKMTQIASTTTKNIENRGYLFEISKIMEIKGEMVSESGRDFHFYHFTMKK